MLSYLLLSCLHPLMAHLFPHADCPCTAVQGTEQVLHCWPWPLTLKMPLKRSVSTVVTNEVHMVTH